MLLRVRLSARSSALFFCSGVDVIMAHPFISPELRVDSETFPQPSPNEIDLRPWPACGDVAGNLQHTFSFFRQPVPPQGGESLWRSRPSLGSGDRVRYDYLTPGDLLLSWLGRLVLRAPPGTGAKYDHVRRLLRSTLMTGAWPQRQRLSATIGSIGQKNYSSRTTPVMLGGRRTRRKSPRRYFFDCW
jgi:hypothetical protein